MDLVELQASDFDIVMDLFCECFADDHFYKEVFPDVEQRVEQMRKEFHDAIMYTLEYGVCKGIVEGESKHLLAFVLCFDYKDAFYNHRHSYDDIFASIDNTLRPSFLANFHRPVMNLSGKTLYLMSIAVLEKYRGQGIASSMLDCLITEYKNWNIVSDVSNTASLPMYMKRGFL